MNDIYILTYGITIGIIILIALVVLICNYGTILLNNKTNYNKVKFAIFESYNNGRRVYFIKFKYNKLGWLRISKEFDHLVRGALDDYKHENSIAFYNENEARQALKRIVNYVELLKEQKKDTIVEIVDMAIAEDIFKIKL